MHCFKGTVSRWCACSKPLLLSFKKTIELSHWRDKISSRTAATARDSMFTSSFTVIFCLSRLERLNENAVSRRHGSSWRGKANILDWLYFMIFSFHWFFMSGRLQEELSCRCKSTCSTKSGRIRVGCPPLGSQANGIEKNANESTIHNNNTAERTKYDQTTIMTRFTRKSNSTEEDVTGFSSPYLCSRVVLNSGHLVQKSKCGACAVTGYCSFKSWTFHCKHYILS